MPTARPVSWPAVAFFSVLFLFFFQLLTDFVAAIYAFGLLGTDIPLELIVVVLLFAPAILIFLRSDPPPILWFALGKLVLISRVIETLLDTRGEMIVSGLGVAFFLLFLPLLLWEQGRRRNYDAAVEMGLGLTLGLALSVLLRTLGSGQDFSTAGWGQVIGWGLAILAGAAWVYLWVMEDDIEIGPEPLFIRPVAESRLKIAGLSLGLMATFILLYFAFTAPQVLSRWSGVDYRLILPVMMVVLALFAWIVSLRQQILAWLTPLIVLIWNALFVVALVLTVYAYQVAFPSDPTAYPLTLAPTPWFAHIPLFLTLILFPVILLDFTLLSEEIVVHRPSLKGLGIGFTLASLYLLVMIFAHVFTTTYDYIPVVGPFFRDKFWLVHLVAGVVLFLTMLLAYRRINELPLPRFNRQVAVAFAGFVAGVAVVAVLGALLVNANPRTATPGDSLKILTYNIQQGYSADGQKNFDGQLALLRGIDADIIGLQETDTARIAGGNSDVVRYFTDKLDMHSTYGPSTVTGTFGIALLSKYPIKQPHTHFLYSEGEQVAVIEAEIAVGEQSYTVFVTHLGNGGPMIQQEQFLELVEGKDNVIAMGDWNFRPDSEQYALTTTSLADSWLLAWPDWTDDQGQNPRPHKIDHIFVTPSASVLDAAFIDDPASDHPAVAAKLAGPK
ncbi:MAG TPA: hypothetical protein G4N94_04055 [Caldilineae bacterium]|nr:hypothetical protein [Caldilineae bacterium]